MLERLNGGEHTRRKEVCHEKHGSVGKLIDELRPMTRLARRLENKQKAACSGDADILCLASMKLLRAEEELVFAAGSEACSTGSFNLSDTNTVEAGRNSLAFCT